MPVVFQGVKQIDIKRRDSVYAAVELLNTYLEGNKFATGNTITIADHCLMSSMASLMAAGFNIYRYKNVKEFVERCQREMKGYANAMRGLPEFEGYFKPKLAGML